MHAALSQRPSRTPRRRRCRCRCLQKVPIPAGPSFQLQCGLQQQAGQLVRLMVNRVVRVRESQGFRLLVYKNLLPKISL
uniref:Uncharacterized protein n=1 Tax=Oryza brachyantha TaxID=4533 RepID=J3LRA6_ORYBR